MMRLRLLSGARASLEGLERVFGPIAGTRTVLLSHHSGAEE